MYPDFLTRFYVHIDFIKHPYANFLYQASRLSEQVELEVIDIPYQGTQLTTYRVKPLWEHEVDFVFCRDVDYALHSIERKSVDCFLNQTDCIVHDIRGYQTHNIIPAGLCGFNVKEFFKIAKEIAPTFKDYIEWGISNVPRCVGWKWESEQLLIKHFLLQFNIEERILDCPQGSASLKLRDMPDVKLCQVSEYRHMKLEHCDKNIQQFIDSLYFTPTEWNKFPPFIGRAWTCKFNHLMKLIALANNKMSRLVEKCLWIISRDECKSEI